MCSLRKIPKQQQLLNVMTHVMNVMAHDCFWSGMDGSQSCWSQVDAQMEALDEKTGFRQAIRIPSQISQSAPADLTGHRVGICGVDLLLRGRTRQDDG